MREHGRTRYLIDRCRCDICRNANKQHSARYREKLKAERPERTLTIKPTPEQGEWRNQAACRNHPISLWFDDEPNRWRQAKAICQICPVRTDCLRYALQFHDMHGIWGGTTVNERRTLRKKLKLT